MRGSSDRSEWRVGAERLPHLLGEMSVLLEKSHVQFALQASSPVIESRTAGSSQLSSTRFLLHES